MAAICDVFHQSHFRQNWQKCLSLRIACSLKFIISYSSAFSWQLICYTFMFCLEQNGTSRESFNIQMDWVMNFCLKQTKRSVKYESVLFSKQFFENFIPESSQNSRFRVEETKKLLRNNLTTKIPRARWGVLLGMYCFCSDVTLEGIPRASYTYTIHILRIARSTGRLPKNPQMLLLNSPINDASTDRRELFWSHSVFLIALCTLPWLMTSRIHSLPTHDINNVFKFRTSLYNSAIFISHGWNW